MAKLELNSPSNLDYALHGRLIEHSMYRDFWNTTILLLNRDVGGPIMKRLSKAKVRFDLQICDTACIANHEKIFVNPTFFHQFMKSPHDMAGVILHELLHPFVDPFMTKTGILWNVITDVLINSIVYDVNPDFTKWMPTFYDNTHYPSILLSPNNHAIWNTLSSLEFFEGLTFPIRTDHIQGYSALYPVGSKQGNDRPSLDAIYELYFKQDEENYKEVPLIGVMVEGSGNSGSGNGQPIPTDAEITVKKDSSEVKEIEASMDKADAPGNDGEDKAEGTSAGKSGELVKRTTDILDKEDIKRSVRNSVESGIDISKSLPKTVQRSNKDSVATMFKTLNDLDPGASISKAFKAAASPDVRNIVANDISDKPVSNRTIIPSKLTRSGTLYLVNKHIPVFWKKRKNDQDESVDSTTAIYLDVSGSFMGFIPWSLGLINQVSARCSLDDMYVFSTQIVKVTLDQIRDGEYYSTGGTAFDVVIDHFTKQPLKKALIITDGHDSLSKIYRQRLEDSGQEAYVLLISHSEDPSTTHLDWAKNVYTHTMKRDY